MSASSRPSVDQLKRAIKLSEQIQALEAELAAILGKAGASAPASNPKAAKAARKERKKPVISEEGKARIAAAQRARWARQKKAAKTAAKAAS